MRTASEQEVYMKHREAQRRESESSTRALTTSEPAHKVAQPHKYNTGAGTTTKTLEKVEIVKEKMTAAKTTRGTAERKGQKAVNSTSDQRRKEAKSAIVENPFLAAMAKPPGRISRNGYKINSSLLSCLLTATVKLAEEQNRLFARFERVGDFLEEKGVYESKFFSIHLSPECSANIFRYSAPKRHPALLSWR